MAFPFFQPHEDPGPSFSALLQRTGMVPAAPTDKLEGVTHGTTVIAIRYADGVVMAGDRRATSGHLISQRTMEKVYPAVRPRGVGIAGAAGPAMDMVKLFQLEIEHNEETEDSELSLGCQE